MYPPPRRCRSSDDCGHHVVSIQHFLRVDSRLESAWEQAASLYSFTPELQTSQTRGSLARPFYECPFRLYGRSRTDWAGRLLECEAFFCRGRWLRESTTLDK